MIRLEPINYSHQKNQDEMKVCFGKEPCIYHMEMFSTHEAEVESAQRMKVVLHAKGTDIKKVRLYIHSAVTKHPQGSEPPPVLGVRVSCNRLLRPIPG
ncbi:hypothetical protein FQA47_010319 [Oryzias melastigma]|uniref:Uncharacterized protein n=1 Tax=Oryzias melastigma TaxID=30732 RepID=A0A834C7W4_ORYME|nr:hypothetical protein FQA47_010319 [Oryzias melastigma]